MSTKVVEHIVLFDVKRHVDPSKFESLRKGLKDLATIDGVLTLSAGRLQGCRSTSADFDLLLHGRFRNKEDLRNYLKSPKHLSLLGELMNPIADGVVLLDWFADIDEPIVPPPGSAMRLSLFKLKEGFVDSEREKVMDVIGGMKDHFGTILQHSYGENFNPKDAYGFTVACIAIFPGLQELNALDSTEDVNKQMDKIKNSIESVVEVDYVF